MVGLCQIAIIFGLYIEVFEISEHTECYPVIGFSQVCAFSRRKENTEKTFDDPKTGLSGLQTCVLVI